MSCHFEAVGQRKAEEDIEEACYRGKCESWFTQGRCTSLIKVDCWHWSDCFLVEVNLATTTCLGYYHVLNIGLSVYELFRENDFKDQNIFYSTTASK